MSVPFGPFVLTWDGLTKQIRRTFEQFTDPCQGKNTRYPLVDAGLSAVAVCFLQSLSLLEYPCSLDQRLGKNNAQTRFGVPAMSSDTQLRHRLDATAPSQGKPLLSSRLQALNPAGVIEPYRAVTQTLRLGWEGNGVVFLTLPAWPALFDPAPCHRPGDVVPYRPNPGTGEARVGQVIPLAPEWVRAQDGAARHGCELTAAQRWRADGGGDYRRWTGQRRKIDTSRYAESIPRREGDDALQVNCGELTTTDTSGQGRYHNALAPCLSLDDRRVREVVAAGRSRWKIDNDTTTTLKTKGYHCAHHHGPGQQYWSSVLASLILLAFVVHRCWSGWTTNTNCSARNCPHENACSATSEPWPVTWASSTAGP